MKLNICFREKKKKSQLKGGRNIEKIIQNNPPRHNGGCDLEGLEDRNLFET